MNLPEHNIAYVNPLGQDTLYLSWIGMSDPVVLLYVPRM